MLRSEGFLVRFIGLLSEADLAASFMAWNSDNSMMKGVLTSLKKAWA